MIGKSPEDIVESVVTLNLDGVSYKSQLFAFITKSHQPGKQQK